MTPEERAAALAELDELHGYAIDMAFGAGAHRVDELRASLRKALEAPVPSEALRKARAEEAAAWETYADAMGQDASVLAYGTACAATRARGALESKIMNAALA